MLGIAANAAAGHRGFLPFHGWVVTDAGPVAVAARTPPRNVVLADPVSDEALTVLTRAVVSDMPYAPGVVGNVPEVERFADRWIAAAGGHASTVLRQGVFALEEVLEPPRPDGVAQAARSDDVETIVRWWLASQAEALPFEQIGEDASEEMLRAIEQRLEGDGSGIWVWRLGGEPVSMSGYGGPTGTGIRIGRVYTPPELRRNGYATALVADLSTHLLAGGRNRCFLYTDLENPTSNRSTRRSATGAWPRRR